MDFIKPITSDHDLIKLAGILNVHLDAIYESSEITKPLPKKGTFIILLRKPNMDVGHWTCAHNGSYFDSMGEGPPTSFGVMKYNELQTQSARADYCGMHGASIWSSIWESIKKAFKFAKNSGILSRAADVGIPALATALGAPQGAIPARAGLKAMTGIGVDGYESASDTEGGRITRDDIKKGAKQALRYAKQKGILTD
ncbi:unnamed protein product [Phytophthora lilii]|uniref:Unnamed protein product n=1 Tax=Phytophthora lilii TaxID=2077276 RepID=A0A9W6U6C8_9STRA|nr:unnamed protein product [Phytophthora lilii]